VFDKAIKNEIKTIFEIQWSDNVKARILDPSLSNKFVKQGKKEAVRSQTKVYEYLLKENERAVQ
jgi:polyphosphate kinase